MELKLIGSVKGSDTLDNEGEFDYMSKGYDSLEELKEASDIIRMTLKDGSIEIMSRLNFGLGRCDCCNESGLREKVELYEGFTVT